MKIRDVEFNSNVFLAPMAGVTNAAFKEIVRSESDCLLCTEMVNDKAIIHDNKKTKSMVVIDEMEHPVSVQLFGNEVDTMVKAAVYLDKYTTSDIIDINMGCPAPKITKNMSGSKILLDTNKVYEILKNIVNNVSKPVTVKMRLGWDDNNINIIDNALAAQKAGVSAIIIHGRTTKQMYSGKADWSYIKKVKEILDIPVIGNGDIDSAIKAKEMIDYSKVDGVMVGRAAIGNPWLLNQIDTYIKTGILVDEPTIDEKVDQAIKHLDKLVSLKGERVACLEMRMHAPHYLRGIKGAAKYKKEVVSINNYEEFVGIMNKVREVV